MPKNKVNPMSQFDGSEIEKDVHDFQGQAYRTLNTRSAVTRSFTHFDATYNSDNRPTRVKYYQGLNPQITKVSTVPDISGSLNNKALEIYAAPSNTPYFIWFNVNGSGSQPSLGTGQYIEVLLNTNDTAIIVAKAIELTLNSLYNQFFKASVTDSILYIETVSGGIVSPSIALTSGFLVTTQTSGTQELVKDVIIDYNGINPIWEGEEIKNHSFNVFSGHFENYIPLNADGSINVKLGQTLDTLNSVVIDDTVASPGNPWVGDWFRTRSHGYVRQLTVLASNVSSGLGGTFTFEFSEDGVSATISEVRHIDDFATVRDFDLINAGEYYRVQFEPDRILTSGELVFINTTQRLQNDGAFVRLANQQIEEQNAAMGQTFSYLKAFDSTTGKSVNIRPSPNEALRVSIDNLYQTPSGSLFVEGIRDDLSYKFDRDTVTTEITRLTDASVGGVVTPDTTIGQAVFSTGAVANNVVFFLSDRPGVYETAHGVRSDQTIEISRALTGTEKVEWGWGETDTTLSPNDIYNGIGYGADATGTYVFRKNKGVYTAKVYQTGWNRDKCDGVIPSLFKFDGEPQALSTLKDNLYYCQYEWLGAFPQEFFVGAPSAAKPLLTHVLEYANQFTGSSVPNAGLRLFVRAITDGTQLQVRSGSWRGGVFTNKLTLTAKNPDGDFIDVPAPGAVSSMSSTTNLTAGATFAPSLQLTNGWKTIAVSVYASHASATNGLSIECFSDLAGTKTLGATLFTYDTANAKRKYEMDLVGKSYKVSYTNGATTTTSFNIFTQLGIETNSGGVSSVETPINPNSGGQLVKAVTVGKQEDGTYANVGLSNRASLKVAITDRPSEVRNRVYKNIYLAHTTLVTGAGTTFYTVTAGKTLYIHSITLTIINDANAIGEFILRDGTTNLIGFLAAQKAVGAAAGSAAPSPNLPEPLKFTTSVNFLEVTGDIHIAGNLVGYEE